MIMTFFSLFFRIVYYNINFWFWLNWWNKPNYLDFHLKCVSIWISHAHDEGHTVCCFLFFLFRWDNIKIASYFQIREIAIGLLFAICMHAISMSKNTHFYHLFLSNLLWRDIRWNLFVLFSFNRLFGYRNCFEK